MRLPADTTLHPDDEARRLQLLRELLVLDSEPETLFDTLARMASDACGTPVALLSLVDEQRQWFKAQVGLPGPRQTPREQAFCAHAIQDDALFEVPDATQDARFANNPLVTGRPDIRFYAAAPLRLRGGHRVGTLCVIDTQPRQLSPAQRAQLQSLAVLASQALEMRRDLLQKALAVRSSHEDSLRASQAQLQRTERVAGVGGWELDLRSSQLHWSDQTRRIHEVAPGFVPTLDSALGFYAPEARPVVAQAVQAGIESGRGWDLELPLVSATGRPLWVRAMGEVEFEDGRAVRLVGAFQDITERRQLQQRVADSERFLRQIADNLPLRIAYVDADLRYRFVNAAHCQRFGRPQEQIVGRTRDELLGAGSWQAIAPQVQAVLAGQPQRFEFDDAVAGADGHPVRRIESQLLPDVDAAGQVRGFFAIGIDITERSAVERSLRELTAIVHNGSDFVVQTDTRGRVTYMNPAARRAVGVAADAPLAGLNFTNFHPPGSRQLFAEVVLPHAHAHGLWLGQTAVWLAGRREVQVSDLVIAHRGADGSVERYSAVMRDISADMDAQRALRRQTATLRSVTEAVPAIVAVFDAEHHCRFVNGAFERWIGAPRERTVGRSLQALLGRAEHERMHPWLQRVQAGETVNFEVDYPTRDSARHLAWSYIPLWLDGGGTDGFIAVAQDITVHKQETTRLTNLAQRDPLTGLLNRAGFEAHLERCLADGGGPALALLYIDLDRFKPVNDQHGHPVGDRLLQAFAQRLLQLVRPTDAVARLGGDEFAIALVGVGSVANAQMVADKVIAAALLPFGVGDLRLHIGASIGLAFGASADGDGWAGLIARADSRLYEAKAAGRGRHAG